MEPRHDQRRSERHPCDQMINVLWRDPAGQEKFVRAKALDICELGLRFEMPEALQRQTYLSLSGPKLGLTGNASVRHCSRNRSSKFAVGVEFTSGLRWKPKN